MISRKRILVFTASYNEKENIKKLILGIKYYLPEASILIIDDNSPDQTKEIIKELKKNISQLELIIREKKLGLDSAHRQAYDYAIKYHYNYLITMDADLSHDPKEINNFVSYLSEFPFVIGSRYVEGGSCLMSGKRLAMSKFGNKLIKNILQINSNEFTTSYRGFNLSKLKNFHLNKVNNKGYSFFMGTLFEIDKLGYEIKEIPIIFKDRQKGFSKIPKIEIFRTLKNLFILFLKKKFKF